MRIVLGAVFAVLAVYGVYEGIFRRKKNKTESFVFATAMVIMAVMAVAYEPG